MEALIRVLITIAAVTAVLLALIVIAVLVHYIRMKKMAHALLISGKRDSEFVYQLLRTAFPSGRIFRRPALPYLAPDGTRQRVPTDLMLVDRGGIFVIRVITTPGMVDNSGRPSWTIRTPKGTSELPNPFEQNRHAVKAVENLLQKESLYNVPRYNLVVFAAKKVAFRQPNDRLLTADRMLDALKDLNRNKFLSQNEISATVSALRKYLTPRKRPTPQ